MQDTRALLNPRNLSSWRTWEGEAFWRSGFFLFLALIWMLTVVFSTALTLYKLKTSDAELGAGLFLAATLGLMFIAMLRLNAWKRANPWTPPS